MTKRNKIELCRHLGAPDQGEDRPRRAVERGGQRVEFGLHQFPGRSRQQMRERFDRSMRAMRCGEGVIDIDVAEFGEGVRKTGRVGFLPLVETEIFEQRDLARPKGRDRPFRLLADAIGGKGDMAAADRLLQRRDQLTQREGRVGLTLRTAEMRHDDDFGVFVD